LKRLFDKRELEKIERKLAPYLAGNSTRDIVDKSMELLKEVGRL
jgi:hypothetical protein